MISGNRVLFVRLERLSAATKNFGKPLTIFSFLSMRSNSIYCCRRYTQVPSWLAAQRLFQHKSNQKQFLFKKLIQFNLFLKRWQILRLTRPALYPLAPMPPRRAGLLVDTNPPSLTKIKKKKRKNPSLLGTPKQTSTRMSNVSSFAKNFSVKASTLQILSVQVFVSYLI